MAPVFFFLRFIRRPLSSSDEEYPDVSSSLSAGGGVAALLRKLDFPFADLFLNIATGCGGFGAAVEGSAPSMVCLFVCLFKSC